MERLEREVLAGANGLFAGKFFVPGKVGPFAQDVSLQPVNELGECGKLLLARAGLLKVTDKADTDGALVEPVAFKVSAK